MLLLVGSPKRLMKSEKALSFPLRILFFKTQRLGIKKAGSCTGAHILAMAGVGCAVGVISVGQPYASKSQGSHSGNWEFYGEGLREDFKNWPLVKNLIQQEHCATCTAKGPQRAV